MVTDATSPGRNRMTETNQSKVIRLLPKEILETKRGSKG
jgi:hypothetical protein